MSSKARKRRSAAGSAAEPQSKRSRPSVELNEDALSLVMEFLAPKELYRMALTCKALRQKVTVRVVVRSTIMHGGNPKITVTELYDLLKNHAIHAPSPLRLLRLVNGKRCESCNESKVNHTRQGYGVFLCWDCLTKGPEKHTVKMKSKRASFEMNPRYLEIIDDPRVAGRQTSGWTANKNMYAWSRPLIQCGELCGPRITYSDIERVARSKEPVETMLSALMQEQEGQREFVEAFETSVEEAAMAERERLEKKQSASKKAADSKKANALRIISKIQDLLEEPWRDFALRHKETGYSGNRPCLRFTQPFCNELLTPYITAPSKAKKSVITNLAEEINRRFRSAEQLVGFSFLSDDDPFQATAKPRLRSKYPDLKSIVFQRCFGKGVFDLIEEGKLFEAMVEACGSRHSDLWGTFLLPIEEAVSDNERRMAQHVWNKEFWKPVPDQESDPISEVFSKAFTAAMSSFERVKASTQEYFGWLDAKGTEWLTANGATGDFVAYAQTHMHYYDRRYLDCLYDKNYEDLFRMMAQSAGNIFDRFAWQGI